VADDHHWFHLGEALLHALYQALDRALDPLGVEGAVGHAGL
jgi:hypothetical protein